MDASLPLGLARDVSEMPFPGEIAPWWVLRLALSGIVAGVCGTSVLIGGIGVDEDRRLLKLGVPWSFALVVLCLVLMLTSISTQGNPFVPLGSVNFREPVADVLVWADAVPPDVWLLLVLTVLSVLLSRSGQPTQGRGKGWLVAGLRTLALGAAILVGSTLSLQLDSRHGSLWPDSTWIAALSLGSATLMGLACHVLRGSRQRNRRAVVRRLESFDRAALALQGACLLGLGLTLFGNATLALGRWPGVLIPAFVVPVGGLLPISLRWLAGERGSVVAALLVLIGAVALRAALVGTPGALLVPR